LNFVPIFVNTEKALYANRRAGNTDDELERLSKLWQDPSYLFKFFKRNEAKLKQFCKNVEIDEAVMQTIKDAENLFKKVKAAKSSKAALDGLFFPYHHEDTSTEFVQMQIYGKNLGAKCNSWLRIYAIKQANSDYYICGGIIKLTDGMQDSEGGQDEEKYFNDAQKWLMSKK
jgi:hypothetical protein